MNFQSTNTQNKVMEHGEARNTSLALIDGNITKAKTKGDTMISLEDWMDEWAEAVESGQSSISRAEAIRRWNQYQLDANEIDREEMEAERNDHRKIKETRE